MRILLVLLLLVSVGCTCQTENAFKKIWHKQVQKLYNWVLADNEASKYRDQEDASRAYLKELRQLPDVFTVSRKLIKDGFHWRAENVDFTSYGWVTIARKRGDCDDFMVLWATIFKYSGGKTERVSVSSTENRGHAMLLYYPKGTPRVFLLSNCRVLGEGELGEEKNLIRRFYGDKTDCFILY